MHRRCLLVTLGASALPATAAALTPQLQAPNVVVISPRLVTSGQPGASALSRLGAQGFDAVIYLAPPTVSDAVADEPALLQRQGLRHINIAIPFDAPSAAHFERFVAAMAELADKRVLVHCQVNMRASTMVFLHRVIVGKEAPETAYEAVSRVWVPSGPWRQLVVSLLRRHGINFEPY
jgi:protein tyrosine phosphatase (PTP) superfamily phosphohydrolase (DUF442 family)